MLKNLKNKLLERLIGDSKSAVPTDKLNSRMWVYNHRLSQFELLHGSAPIVMIGDSLVENGEWGELLHNYHVLNRGISSDTANGVQERLYEVIERNPKLLIGMIGINDLAQGMTADELVESIRDIVNRLNSENINILWQSVICTAPPRAISNEAICEANALLKVILEQCDAHYLDLNPVLCENGMLSQEVSEDGLHLNGKGYRKWAEALSHWLDEQQSIFQ